MACVDDKGNLTASARKMLEAMTTPTTPEELGRHTGLPLYLIRSGLREMVQAGLVEEHAGKYTLAAKGRSMVGSGE